MESFKGLLNSPSSCFLGEHLAEVNCLEQGFVDAERFKVEEGDGAYMNMNMISSLDHSNMPFLQMLQSLQQYPQFCSFQEPISFKVLQQQQEELEGIWESTQNEAAVETHHDHLVEMQLQLQPPLKSESNEPIQQPHSASVTENVCNQKRKDEGRKRKRRRQQSNKKKKKEEDVEQQRMIHIAVERNRRRQMNHHLTLLKSLTPPSYIQRGDQASIIGGAIDLVKELEQLLESLEAQKRMRKKKEDVGYSSRGDENGIRAENNKSEEVAAEVTVIQTHVNLKIQCPRRAGQLINAIVELEKLRLTILHLNITSSHAANSVLYSFNLKIEEDSKIGSASEIAEAVNRIFSSINYNGS